MKSLIEHLSNYATYHRDRRNIATHFVGIPMIVAGVSTLLSRAAVTIGTVPVSAGLLATAGATGFYWALDKRYGAAMTVAMGASLAGGAFLASQPLGIWLASGLGLFVGGWAIQFVGHYFEGKKPAFVDDLIGLLVGPLFVVAELGFKLGLRKDVEEEIIRRAGPTVIRTNAPKASKGYAAEAKAAGEQGTVAATA